MPRNDASGGARPSDGGPKAEQLFGSQRKIEDLVLIRVVAGFCQGISVSAAAKAAGLTAKTTRAIFLDLRERLRKPAFNRWNATSRRLLNLPDLEQELVVRATFFDVLAECYGNETCYRNYRLGNRKVRQCRKCPIPHYFDSEQSQADALATIDAVHVFYEGLGIRGEKGRDPASLFRVRLIHATVIATARENTRGLPSGLPDPLDMGYLAVGTLMDLLLKDIAEES